MINRLWPSLVRHIDRQLIILVALLMSLGLATLFSASGASFDRVLGQLANIAVALAVMWIAANVPLHYLNRIALPLYVFGVILLIAVDAFGMIVNGAQRWINLGFTRIQPSELMKIALPLMLAWYFDTRPAGSMLAVNPSLVGRSSHRSFSAARIRASIKC